MITFEDLTAMNADELHAVMDAGHPLPLEAMVDTQYQGVDLSLPEFVHKLLWTTFRKTFHRDPAAGVMRGWNVRLEQHGVDGPRVPMKDRSGQPRTFGHYQVKSAEGVRLPRGWKGGHYLDYGCAGNRWSDPGRFGFAPLVAVNPGRHELLLGWEVMKVGGVFVPMRDYWALRLEGPLEHVVAVPRP